MLHVSNVEASLRFYVDRLGFKIPWQFEGVARSIAPVVSAVGGQPSAFQ